jgi:uncharacterized metal-binding protein YceD (DUF177 family)
VRSKHPYTIPFVGLKLGVHHFDFQIEDSFFKDFEFSEVTSGCFQVQVVVEKKSSMMEVTINMKGVTPVICDKCAEEFSLDVSGSDHWVIKWGDKTEDSDDDVWIFGPKEHFIDVQHRIYELIHLSLPAKRVHDEGQCNPEVIAALNQYSAVEDQETQWISLKNMELENNTDLLSDDDSDEEE